MLKEELEELIKIVGDYSNCREKIRMAEKESFKQGRTFGFYFGVLFGFFLFALVFFILDSIE